MRTAATFERTGAMREILDAVTAPKHLRFILRGLAWPIQWIGYRGDPDMPPTVRAMTALGPAYIKFGQLMSTRPDVVGADLAGRLRVLQDRLPAFSTELAKEEFARELGHPVDEIFSEFSDAIAAASIAQVHEARLAETGAEVAVKVLRPRIEAAFRRDIDAFHFAAHTIEFLSPASRRLHPLEVIRHFEGVVAGELDLRLEAAAASEFAANTKDDEQFDLPAIHWSLSARRVMTQDWARGTNLGDVEELQAKGHDLVDLGARVLRLFLLHALRDGMFHADMHHGNLKVAADGSLIAFDFGIMGHIDDYTRRVYSEILYGFITRDYHRVAEVHFEAGYVPASRDVDEFARALRSVGEPILGMEASQISMGHLLAHLFEVTERFGMETRTELILLQRTMVVVEGVARSLDPGINIWEVARPVVEDYIKTNLGPRAMLADLRKTALVLARFGPKLPSIVESALAAQSAPKPPARREPSRLGRAVFALGLLGLGLLLGVML